MKTLNYSGLLEIVKNSKGVLIVGIRALTDSRARKTNNPFGVIYKEISAVGFVGANYGKAILNEGFRQGETVEFEAQALPWGNWLVINKVIEHKGALYLRTQTTPGQRRKQPAKVLNYRNASGHILNRELVKPFLPVASESAKQQDAGLDETIWVRTYAFSSIKKIRVNGETFKLEEQAKPKTKPVKSEKKPFKKIQDFSHEGDGGDDAYWMAKDW